VSRLIVAQTPNEIETLRERWEGLPASTIFQSFAWNYAAARAFGDREAPLSIYSETNNGAALIPAAISESRLTLLGEKLADYRDVLANGDGAALYAAWHRASELNLTFSAGALRDDSNLSLWHGFQRNSFYGAPLVSTGQISEDQFASDHNRLSRWKRRLEREGATFRLHSGTNAQLVRHIYELKASQAAESADSLFRDPQRIAFMVEVCRALASACEIFTVEHGSGLLASLVTFRDHTVRRFYTIHFHPAWARYSPGMVLIYEVTRRSLAVGLDCDYMTGEHDYKMRFATSVVPMYWLEASAHDLATLSHRRALAA